MLYHLQSIYMIKKKEMKMKAVCSKKKQNTSRQAAAPDETKYMTATKKNSRKKHVYSAISET